MIVERLADELGVHRIVRVFARHHHLAEHAEVVARLLQPKLVEQRALVSLPEGAFGRGELRRHFLELANAPAAFSTAAFTPLAMFGPKRSATFSTPREAM